MVTDKANWTNSWLDKFIMSFEWAEKRIARISIFILIF